MTKRIISMLLVLTMVLSIAVVGVSAATPWGGMTDIEAPTAGTGTSADPFIIDTPQKLAWIAAMVEDTVSQKAFLESLGVEKTADEWADSYRKAFQGFYFKQTADIDLGGKEFMPIGSYMSATYTNRRLFGGVYDGGGFKIMNAKVSMADHIGKDYYKNTEASVYTAPDPLSAGSAGHYDALFNLSSGAAVKNLNVVNVQTGNYDAEHTGATAAGVIAGFIIQATIMDCTTDNTSSATATVAAGGMAVVTNGDQGSTIINCTNNAAITAKRAAGIIASPLYAKDKVTSCTNNGKITGGEDANGGIVAQALSNMTIDGCKNTGAVTSAKEVGGIVGKLAGMTPTVSNCTNSGDVSTTRNDYAARAGGIVGAANGAGVQATISNCTNSGTISAAGSAGAVGGIAGRFDGGSLVDCTNSGTINTSNPAGGILAQTATEATNTVVISGCENSGNITSSGATSGVVGEIAGAAVVTITTSVNKGTVRSTGARAGGIVGNANKAPLKTISYCDNEGTVISKGNNAGGIAGALINGDVSYCNNKSTGVVRVGINGGTAMAGGIIGYLMGGKVYSCANYGLVDATNFEGVNARGAGGIVGYVESTSLGLAYKAEVEVISNCVNYGTAQGRFMAGGIVCVAGGVTLKYCSNFGTVAATNGGGNVASVGGLIGSMVASSDANGGMTVNTISHCVNDGTLSAQTGGNVSMAAMVGGSSGYDGQWNANKKPTALLVSDSFNLSETFTITGTVRNPAASTVIGYGYDGNSAGSSLTVTNFWTVDGYTTTDNMGNIDFDAATGKAHQGLIANIASVAQLTQGLGENYGAKFTDIHYGVSAQDIENESIYKDIIAATPVAPDDRTIKFIGVQDSLIKGNTYDVRFVAGLDSTEFKATGFKVTVSYTVGGVTKTSAEKTFTTDTVYESLTGKKGDETVVYNAADYGTSYFVALSIEGINLATYGAVTFTVTPFTTDANGAVQDGYAYVVSYDADGNFVGCARQGA